MHPTPELIEALRKDDIPQTLGELLLINHLASVCTTCQGTLLAARQRATDRFANRLLDIWSLRELAEDEGDIPQRELEELLDIPSQAERLRRIERAYARFRSPLLVVLALAEARSAVAAAPDTAFRYAEIACAVARDGKAPPTCLPLALAYAGNARRAAGELPDAEPYFAHAYDILGCCREEPHPWILAEVASLEGSLLKDARRLETATTCLDYACQRFADAGDATGIARVRVKLATVYRLNGEPKSALVLIQKALAALRGTSSPKLLVAALHSFVMFLAEDGQLDRAQTILHHLSPVYGWYPEFEDRHLWLRAKVARGREEFEAAEHYYREVLRAFISKSSTFDAALVALDLAELLITSGRAAEVANVTRPLPTLFRAQGVHREATAAIVMFHKAASHQALSLHLLTRLRTFFERSPSDQTLRFSPRSPGGAVT